MKESSLVTYNNRTVCFTQGNASSVEFNFLRVWEFYKDQQNKSSGFEPALLHFYHVHPQGCESYSTLDINCFQGFEIAFNFQIYFSIIIFKNENYLYDVQHILKQYVCSGQTIYDLSKGFVVCDLIQLSEDQLFLLKLLSYNGVKT